MAGDNKPHPSANCSLDAATVGDDDGLDAGAEAFEGIDGARHFQRLPHCHDTSLRRLQVKVRSSQDILLQDAQHAVIERVVVGLLRSLPS